MKMEKKKEGKKGMKYEKDGVDIDEGKMMVEKIKKLVR